MTVDRLINEKLIGVDSRDKKNTRKTGNKDEDNSWNNEVQGIERTEENLDTERCLDIYNLLMI